MTLAQNLALWADHLRDISAMGLRFSPNLYDRENYEAIQEIALEMLAVATGLSPDELEPLRTGLLRRPTPLSTGDAAIIDDSGRILLIRRADNGLWAMPGGALAVGEHELPSMLDPGHVKRIPEAFRAWHGDLTAYFDR